jgi:AcrR family transcriptional regulator
MTAERSGDVIWMRPGHTGGGRPAQRSREEITAAAMAIADRDGLNAVSMRAVAAELGTGAASLYRYIESREDLLDLMTDAAGAEYRFAEPTGDWLADLIGIGQQARLIMGRHPWVATLVITRPVLGPNGLDLLERVLGVLASCPASLAAKLDAFAMLTAVTALFVQNESGSGPGTGRSAAYLAHALQAGQHPRLAELLAADPAGRNPPTGPAGAESPDRSTPGEGTPTGATPDGGPTDEGTPDRYRDIMARVLLGLLAPA